MTLKPHKNIKFPISIQNSTEAVKEVVINCTCVPKVESEDEFYILCDFCSEWFHGLCHSIHAEMSKGIHKWACATCVGFGKESILLEKCAAAGCINHVVYSSSSKYCSEKCGEISNLNNLKRIISLVKQNKFVTLGNHKYVQDVYSYDELEDEINGLKKEKERVKQEIQKMQVKLTRIDDIVDKVYKSNLNKSTGDMVCGFDYGILECDFNIKEVKIDITDSLGAVDQEREIELVCETVGKCWKHSGWQKLKTIETEIQIEELVSMDILKD
jgi:uncharacterized small protein (DUF1192 family)